MVYILGIAPFLICTNVSHHFAAFNITPIDLFSSLNLVLGVDDINGVFPENWFEVC
jgi:hypothetical protein